MSIYQDDTVKNLKIISGSTDITSKVKSGSFKCDNLLCDDQIAFGSCSSARAQFVTTEDLELTGNKITVQYGSGSTWANLGVYKVTYSSTIENSEEVNITMYDALKNFDVDVAGWYNALEFPLTLQSMRASLALHIGVQQSNATLVNDGIYVDRTINPSKLNGMDVLRYIGELNGVFPHATSDGKLEWLSLGTTATTITSSVIQGANGVSQKTYSTSPISKLCIRSEDGDIGVTVGTGSNAYYVTANVLVYGMTSTQLNTVATNLYNKIAGITYTPTKLSMKCDPTIKMGALLQYGDTSFYLLSRKTSGLLFDEIECDGNQYLEEDNSIETSVEQLRGKSNVLTQTIEATTSRVEDIEDDYTTHTEFTQNAESVNLQLSAMQKQLDGEIEMYTLDYVPTRENYPAWDWTGMFANDGDDITGSGKKHDDSKTVYYANNDLNFLYLNTELQKHLRTIAYNEDTSITYRFNKVDNQYVWQEVADTETSIILSRLTAVEATADGLSVEVSELSTSLEDDYWTTEETQSKIDAKADEIALSVSGTYATKDTTNNLSASLNLKVDKNDNNQIVSMINASADEITLQGGSKINLNTAGKLIISAGNFKLDSSGHVTATGASIGGTLVTSGSGVFDFTWEDLNNIKSYIAGTKTLNANQLRAYDFDCNGSVNLMDFANLKNHLNGRSWSVSSSYVWNSYPITVTIDASNPTQAIKIVGKDNVGVEHTYCIGSNGANMVSLDASVVKADTVNVADVVTVGGIEMSVKDVTINGVAYKILAR